MPSTYKFPSSGGAIRATTLDIPAATDGIRSSLRNRFRKDGPATSLPQIVTREIERPIESAPLPESKPWYASWFDEDAAGITYEYPDLFPSPSPTTTPTVTPRLRDVHPSTPYRRHFPYDASAPTPSTTQFYATPPHTASSASTSSIRTPTLLASANPEHLLERHSNPLRSIISTLKYLHMKQELFEAMVGEMQDLETRVDELQEELREVRKTLAKSKQKKHVAWDDQVSLNGTDSEASCVKEVPDHDEGRISPRTLLTTCPSPFAPVAQRPGITRGGTAVKVPKIKDMVMDSRQGQEDDGEETDDSETSQALSAGGTRKVEKRGHVRVVSQGGSRGHREAFCLEV